MFKNIAPVLPGATLEALERVANTLPGLALRVWRQYRSLLRSLAYDPSLFHRSAGLLARVATESEVEREATDAAETFTSMFTIYLSGTHARIEQRLDVIEPLLRSGEPKARKLGLAAMGSVLKTRMFSSSYRFDFAAWSRDFDYRPESGQQTAQWYGAALAFIERLALLDGEVRSELRNLLAGNLRGLWSMPPLRGELERLFRRFAADGFWREGWVACWRKRRDMRGHLIPEEDDRLAALERDLDPSSLLDQVRANVLGDRFGKFALNVIGDDDDAKIAGQRMDAMARELGTKVAADDAALCDGLVRTSESTSLKCFRTENRAVVRNPCRAASPALSPPRSMAPTRPAAPDRTSSKASRQGASHSHGSPGCSGRNR